MIPRWWFSWKRSIPLTERKRKQIHKRVMLFSLCESKIGFEQSTTIESLSKKKGKSLSNVKSEVLLILHFEASKTAIILHHTRHDFGRVKTLVTI